MDALVEIELLPGDCLVAAATTLVALPTPDEPAAEGERPALLQLVLAEASVANHRWAEAEAHTPGDGRAPRRRRFYLCVTLYIIFLRGSL
jgi:hypothetical protein